MPLRISPSILRHSSRSFTAALAAGLLSLLPIGAAHGVVWGVNGHTPNGSWPVYEDIPASQQLDAVNAIGATYYRGVASTALLNLIQSNSAYANLRLIPIVPTGFSNTDIQQNPNNYTNAYFYSTAETTAINWMNSFSSYSPFPFDCVEIGNELDALCINSGASGSSPTDYNNAEFGRVEAIIQGLCDGVRSVNATVPRMVGCAGWLHYGFIDRLISDLGAPDWERMVYHWYSDMGLMSSHSDVIAKLQGYADTWAAPTWVTETDCRNGSDPLTGETTAQAERRQAGAMEDLIQDMKQFSFIHCICVYELFDEGNLGATEAYYGMYHAPVSGGVYTVGTPKADVVSAYEACRNIDPGATYEMEPGNAPGMRLDVAGGSTVSGANVDIYSNQNSTAQNWQASYMSNGWFEFAPLCAPTMRLDVNGAGSANGTNVKQYTENDSTAQLWFPNSNANGSFDLEPECATSARLDVYQAGTGNSTNVDIWAANGGTNQNWSFYNSSTRQFEAEGAFVIATSGAPLSVIADPSFSAYEAVMYNSTTVGDYLAFVIPNVAAGSYDVRVGVKTLASRGILQLAIGRSDSFSTTQSNVGAPQDLYTASPTFPELDLGIWSPSSTSDKEFRFTVTGKNSASTGYTACIDYIVLIPQW